MRKIGIYGGSFNPIHYGHVGLAEWVVAHTDLDEVWLMVSPNNPLKDPSTLADEHVRLRQVEEAIAGRTGLRASDFEFSLPRPTYTAATLRALHEVYPDTEFVLIIGEDNVGVWDRWREHDWIAANHRILVYPRASLNHQSSTTKQQLPPPFEYLAGAPLFPISSTQIRAQKG